METSLQAEERSAGAKFAESDGCVLPETFAGFAEEYAAAREAVALFDTSWHAYFILTGPDRVRYLNAVVSNNVQALAEGAGTLALLLNPQGRILAELEIFRRPEDLLVRTHASVRERTRETLEKYIIMDDVELTDTTDTTASLAIEGPRAASIVQQACGLAIEELPALSIHDVRVEYIACQLIVKSHFGSPGAEFIGRPDLLRALWTKMLAGVQAHEGQPIGMQALNALRLEAGIPWFPADFNDTVIPHEAALEETHISFSKGCYTGQEIVERVRSRGQVNRRRVRLNFSTAIPPEYATRLFADGKEIGLVASAAFSPRENSAIGMGYVRREHAAPGSVVDFEGGTAQVI
ncbi:MAG TPA: glycine cleavage T C-terminal barrel domain-containing protein [Candidatus Aquilonibacter sp.]|nr:glycine cleavage T C-terminal barrel domain-containing protein [Candidatus Aquilonibacter sp.]